jgi:DNA-directed RNA polymerase subunit omega
MIEDLNDDDLIIKAGGRFKLTALIQKRAVELMQGARPLVDIDGKTLLEVAVAEIAQGKVSAQFPDS